MNLRDVGQVEIRSCGLDYNGKATRQIALNDGTEIVDKP